MAYGKVRVDQIQSSTRTVDVDDLALDSALGTAAALDAGTSAGNVPVLDGAGKIVSGVLPSYVDDVVEYANLAAFPATGETGKIYVAIDTNKTYRWSGSAYIEISSSPVTSVAGRTGVVTLSNTDISGLGTASTKNTGTASGNVVELDGSARLPAVDGSQLTGINTAGTDLTYTAATRLLASSTGTDVTLPLFSSTDAGLAPASSGGTTNFLRADGTFAAPPGGSTDLSYTAATRLLASSTGTDVTLPLFSSTDAGLTPASSGGTTNFLRADGTFAAPPGGSPGGSTTQVQFNNAGVFGGDADLTWNSTTNVLGVTGDVNLNDGGTFTTTLQCITPTANRTVSIADGTGTLAFVAGSSGQLVWNNAGANAGLSTVTTDGTNVTLTGRFISSLNGAASAPPGTFTGTWFTGGTSTTTKPQVLIEPTGTTSTAWSTAGTGFGVNAPAAFAGNLLDLQVNGSSRFKFDVANKRFQLFTDGTRGDAYFDRGGGGGDLRLVGLNGSFDFVVTGFNRGVSSDVGFSVGGQAFGGISQTSLTTTGLAAISFSGQGDRTITMGNRPGFDEVPINFAIRPNSRGAVGISPANPSGSHIFIAGGEASTNSTNTANGGRVNLDGGRAFGTGTDGDIVIGATRGNLQITDARNVVLGTTTGTKIGTATTQKLGFYNATPVVQPVAVANATDVTDVVAQLNALLARMRDLGLIAT